MFDLKEIKRVSDAIKRVLPTAEYYFDEDSLYWHIGLKDQIGVISGVQVNSKFFRDCDDKRLDAMLADIGYQICAKMVLPK